jgi:hypothetical protein
LVRNGDIYLARMKASSPLNKKTIAKASGSLGLSAAAIIWMFQTFALHRDLMDERSAHAETKIELKQTRERLLVIDTIVMQQQRMKSSVYE